MLEESQPAHMHTSGSDLVGIIMASSDLLTGLAYLVIPIALSLFIYQHKDAKFKPILVMFILFIFSCGFQHLLHFTSLWWPTPRLMAGAMAFMAAISLVMAIMIWPVLRQVNRLQEERKELQNKLTDRNRELESALQLANERKLALEQSDKAFRGIIADAPIGMALVSLEGRFTLVNRALCGILKYSASELENLTFHEITHPDDLDSDLFQVGLLLDGMSEKYRIEKRYIRRDGQEVHVQLDVCLVRNEKDEPGFFVAQIQDITASKNTQEALRESRHRFHSLLKNLPTAVVVHRPDSSIEFANPAASTLLGLSEEQLLGKMAIDPEWHFLHEDGSQMSLDDYPVMKVMASKRPLTNYLTGVIQGKDAPICWVLVNAFPLKSPSGSLDRIVVSFTDVSERQALQQALEAQAQTDPLTGLFNRRYLEETAARLLAHARRTTAPLSLLELDLDHFKQINDRHGHAFGDTVLVKLSEVIRELMREDDIACRIGGEEFVVLMPDTDAEQATIAAERLRLKIEESEIELQEGPPLRWTASLGVACLSSEDTDIADLLARADTALYRAKAEGRNRVVKAD